MPKKTSYIGKLITWFERGKCKDSFLRVFSSDVGLLIAPQNSDTGITSGIPLVVVDEFFVGCETGWVNAPRRYRWVQSYGWGGKEVGTNT